MLHTTVEDPTDRRRRVRDRPHRPPRGLHDRGPGDGRQRRRSCCTARRRHAARSSPPTRSCSTTSTCRPARSPSARRPTIKPDRARDGGDHPRRRRRTSSAPRASAASCAGSTDVLALVVTVPAGEAELAQRRALGARRRGDRGAHGGQPGDRGPARRAVDVARRGRRDDHAAPPRRSRRAGAGTRCEIDPAVADTWRAHAVPSWVDRRPRRRAGLAGRRRRRPARLRSTIDPGADVRPRRPPDDRADAARCCAASCGPARRVLDVGCGSGVLSVVAAARSARRTSRRSTSRRPRSRRRRQRRAQRRRRAIVDVERRRSSATSTAVRRRAGQPPRADRRSSWPPTCAG